MTSDNSNDLGNILKQQRVTIPLTLRELAAKSSVSQSHLARVERGERYPSARTLRKLSKPLGFEEDELFTLAGYLSHRSPVEADSQRSYFLRNGVDPYVAAVLSQEPVAVQRTIVAILSVLKSLTRSVAQSNPGSDTRGMADGDLSSKSEVGNNNGRL